MSECFRKAPRESVVSERVCLGEVGTIMVASMEAWLP